MCLLRIAVQAKGRLFEETMALLEESDIKLSTTKRTLLVQSSNFPVEVLFLRDDDIPQSVAVWLIWELWERMSLLKKGKTQKSSNVSDSVNAVCRWQCRRMSIIPVWNGLMARRLQPLIL